MSAGDIVLGADTVGEEVRLSDLKPEVRALLEAASGMADGHSGPCASRDCDGYGALGAAAFAFAASVRRGGT